MPRVLSTYVNCSLGGMTSVFRARALADPRTRYDLVFTVDRGGLTAFADLQNCDARVVPEHRLVAYLSHALRASEYDWFTVTSNTELVRSVSVPERTRVAYEVHAALEGVIEKEVAAVDVTGVDELWGPSRWSVATMERSLPRRKHATLRVVPNLVDRSRFRRDGPVTQLSGTPHGVPVLWIGRLENTQKNYSDFLRVLRTLPDRCYGLMLFSFEKDPRRLAAVLGAAAMLGVEDRLRLYLNVPQQEVAALHRAVRDAGGVFCSTALAESFGYGVVEADACGCPVVAYDVGALSEHTLAGATLVPVGDMLAMSEAIAQVSGPPAAGSAPPGTPA